MQLMGKMLSFSFLSTLTRVIEKLINFCIILDMEQIIKHPTCVPDCHDQAPNIFYQFHTANPLYYSYTVSSPLGLSDNCHISVSSSFSPPLPIPPTQRRIQHFIRFQKSDRSDFLNDFPWEDYRFQSCCPDRVARRMTDVSTSVMEAYIQPLNY